MRVLMIPPKYGEVSIKSIPNTLEDLQEAVGGYIDVAPQIQLNNIGLCLICNEEGLLKHLPPNENLFPFFYVGTCLIVATDGDEFIDMSNAQIAWAWEWLNGLTDVTARLFEEDTDI